MLASQRDQFDIPRDIAYLNAAAWSPLPLATQEAARSAVGRKGQPWKLGGDFADAQHERARHGADRGQDAIRGRDIRRNRVSSRLVRHPG